MLPGLLGLSVCGEALTVGHRGVHQKAHLERALDEEMVMTEGVRVPRPVARYVSP
jgi:hypothetical protein